MLGASRHLGSSRSRNQWRDVEQSHAIVAARREAEPRHDLRWPPSWSPYSTSTAKRSRATRTGRSAVRRSGIVGIADRALPEPVVVRRDVEIAVEAAKRIFVGAVTVGMGVALDRPPVQDREAGADIPNRGREVVDAVLLFEHSPTAGRLGDVLVHPRDLLDGILERAVSTSGRIPASSAASAIRADRFDDRTAENVAIASTSVPPAVASSAIVVTSAIWRETRRREQTPAVSTIAELLDGARALVDNGATPACQVAVARDDELLCVRDVRRTATNDTRFCVFSATKPIVASAIWLLIGDGLLDVDAPVAHYIPEFATNGKEVVTRRAGAAPHRGLSERAARPGRGRRHRDAR